jgi:DNA polymerase-1
VALEYVATPDAVERALAPWQAQPPPALGLDIETTGLDPRQGEILLCQLADLERVVVARVTPATRGALRDFLAAYRGELVVQNAKFECQWLLVHWGLRLSRVWDTRLADQVLHCGRDETEESSGLADLAFRYLGLRLPKQLQTSFAGVDPTSWEPTAAQREYAARDAWVVLRLRRTLERRLVEAGLGETARLENALVPVLAEMELRGMAVDVAAWREALAELEATARRVEERLVQELTPPLVRARARQYAAAHAERERWARERLALKEQLEREAPAFPSRRERRAWINAELKRRMPASAAPPVPALAEGPINLGSPPQLLMALRELGIQLSDTRVGTLREYARQHTSELVPAYLIEEILEWRALHKLLHAFGENLLEKVRDGRIYPTFNQLVRTGRLSSRNPNLQQIPAGNRGGPAADFARRIRTAFVAPEGRRLIVADYAAIEHRIACDLYNEQAAIQEYQRGMDADVHRLTASLIYRVPIDEVTTAERQAAKTINYGILYGLSPAGLALRLGCSLEEARDLITRWEQANPALAMGLRRAAEMALRTGESRTPLGRRRLYQVPPRPRVRPEEMPAAWQVYRRQLARIRRQAMNQPIQGCSADITKLALVRIAQRLRLARLDAFLVNAVHDEIVVEAAAPDARAAATIVQEEMLRAAGVFLKRVPAQVDVHVGDTWEH